ncbi:MAG: RNA polymerase sigma-54 factor [Candidatus Cloacimonetes bacterium 4572_55]|nr:MAG: RNA polymerase sigma-54 factor [Candidatus Cloacimonetes bacterium 4572_55]
MEMNLGVNLKLEQKMVIGPRMIQSLALLQMQRLELQQLIQQELVENPLLEDEMLADQEESEEKSEDEKIESNADESEQEEQNWDDYMHDAYEPYAYELGKDSGADETFEPTVRVMDTLQDTLIRQLHDEVADDQQLEIGEEIIGELTVDGYFHISVEEVAERIGVLSTEVEEVLKIIQSFDPVGVGARDLRECLLIQMERLDLQDVLAYDIIRDCFDELKRRMMVDIGKKLKIGTKKADLRDIQDALGMIAMLDPKPGLNVSATPSHYIIPDLFVTQVGEEFLVSVNESDLPRLRVNQQYAGLLRSEPEESKAPVRTNDKAKRERNFIVEKLGSAKWLIRAINQRRRTMTRVMESIIKFQKEFFLKGVSHLKPLTLREVAEDVDVHESTVSRVTSNKYVQTDMGIYELKFFFDSKVESMNGGDKAAVTVTEAIKKIIDNEDPHKPYSDNKIADILKDQNIKIARRTVAKYRDNMKILSARYRKRI